MGASSPPPSRGARLFTRFALDSGASGVYVSLLVAPVVRMGGTQDVGVRVGMSMTVIAIGAVAGPPISGAINAATGAYVFTGVCAGM